jgi:hypothetical protein
MVSSSFWSLGSSRIDRTDTGLNFQFLGDSESIVRVVCAQCDAASGATVAYSLRREPNRLVPIAAPVDPSSPDLGMWSPATGYRNPMIRLTDLQQLTLQLFRLQFWSDTVRVKLRGGRSA